MNADAKIDSLQVHSHSIVHAKFKAEWSDLTGDHTAIHHFERFNIWRDIDLLPEPIANGIMGQPVGQQTAATFAAGELVPQWQHQNIMSVPRKNFIGRLNDRPLVPRVGRFYPSGMLMDIKGLYNNGLLPVRYIEQQGDDMVIDVNHPLANDDINMTVELMSVMPAGDEHGGRCTEAIQELMNGPGMQLPYKGQLTDFLDKQALQRLDESSDENFYRKQRLVHHLDVVARNTISEIYAGLLSPGDHVLDLMASWESHVSGTLDDIQLTGLGMNAAELDANPVMDGHVIQDLNKNPVLPFDSETFDAVICTASVEYLVRPLDVFQQVQRILKPGGKFILTFSNRWFPTKTIGLWPEMHEFERLGLVLQYFRQTHWTNAINTLSSRGMQRPEDDPYYAQARYSDPVYAVWSHK
ncbi:MAG: methyltransferase domain-containing protein [Gammaproteobacteria bacterium]|nr:methyltransferase domain-containing protein [Gammaproteobacteria bacterium]